jgi:hypothetical protein
VVTGIDSVVWNDSVVCHALVMRGGWDETSKYGRVGLPPATANWLYFTQTRSFGVCYRHIYKQHIHTNNLNGLHIDFLPDTEHQRPSIGKTEMKI